MLHLFYKYVPFNKQVRDVHIDTRAKGTVYPFHRPLLHTLKQKDPISRENAFHVSKYLNCMETIDNNFTYRLHLKVSLFLDSK